MTAEEFLALPEDGKDRWLIHGHLREQPMTVRNRTHARIVMRIGQILGNWVDQQPQPRGEILGGEAGCRLTQTPDTVVGIDVVYLSPEQVAQQSEDTTLISGVPTLAVEVLSPNDTQENTHEKISTYLNAGVSLVWIVNPYDSTIVVYRPDSEPVLFNIQQSLSADPLLPGCQLAVEQVFSR